MHSYREVPSTSCAFHAVFGAIRCAALIAALFLCLPVESGTFARGDFSFIKSAHAGIEVGTPGDTVFRPNARTEIVVLGTTTVVDAQGVPHTVEESRKHSLICGGNVGDDAGVESPVLGPRSIPGDFFSGDLFSDDDEPGEETTWTYSVPPGGPLGFSKGGPSSGPTFVITVKGTPPDGAEAAVARVFERYLFHFDDDVTIRFTMKWKSIDPDEDGNAPIGATRNEFLSYSYNTVREALIVDMDSDDVLQNLLPGGSLPVVYDSSGTVNETKIRLTKAGAKAAGLRSPHHSGDDGRITFNTDFAFDFNPYDGISASRMDFELVLLHEVGHLLGFVSSVDFRKKDVESIDLFRFTVSNCASSTSNFGTLSRTASKDQQGIAARSCLPGEMPARSMSTGEDTPGDGNQASHWNGFLGYLGMMIPGLIRGDDFIQSGLFGFEYVTNADLRALDFIGWDYVPVDTSLGDVFLSAPADKSIFVSTTPTLSWTHASNAFDYQLTIFKSGGGGGGGGLETIQTVNVAGLSYPVPSGLLEPNTTYLWRVEARNPYRSEKSSVWQFTTSAFDPLLGPVAFGLVSPVPGAFYEPRTPDMQWDHIPGPDAATSYTIQIDDEENFEEPHVFQHAGIAPGPSPVTFSVPPRILRNDQAYFWRVIGFNGAGSQEAGGGSFAVGSFAPSDFGVLTPRTMSLSPTVPGVGPDEFLATTSATSTFSWQPAWEAEGYTLQIDDDENFSSPVISHSTNQTTYTPTPGLLLSSTAYWWRVLATNSVGAIVSSPSSATFTTSPPAPGTFSAIAPANGSTTSSNAPILRWSLSANATQYIVEIGQDSSLEHPEVTMVVSGADTDGILVPLGLLQPGQTYYWRVTSLNSAGFAETDTDTFHFIMGSGGIGVPGIPVGSAAAFALALVLVLAGVVLSNDYARAPEGAT